MATPSAPLPYPVDLSIDRPDRLSRWSTVFRLVLVIPVALVVAMLTQANGLYGSDGSGVQYLGGFIVLPTVLLLLFRHRYPRWWFDFNVQLLAFSYRVAIYIYLMRDEYPSTEDRQALNLRIPYPHAQTELSRWLPLVKWLLAIPHLIVLFVLGIGALAAIVIAWFAILFTGRYPAGLFDFVEGYMRWSARVTCYAVLMTTDRYPPFSLR